MTSHAVPQRSETRSQIRNKIAKLSQNTMKRQVNRLTVVTLTHIACCCGLGIDPHVRRPQVELTPASPVFGTCRRDALSLLPLFFPLSCAAAVSTELDARSTVTLHLESPRDRAGLELTEVTIGNPARSVVAVKRVLPGGVADRAGVSSGVILLEFPDAKSVTDRIQNGPYPIDLKLYNLAAGGDAFGDMGKPLVTADDALEMAKRTSSSSTAASGGADVTRSDQEYVVRILKDPPLSCGMQSRRGDVLEINYVSRMGSASGPVYDSSAERGTGLPYQFVLGSGDMIAGVDRGLYDMCPGEARQLEIPPVLAFGSRGNKNFGIPGGTRLFWTVELVAVNSVRKGDARTRDEIEGRVPY